MKNDKISKDAIIMLEFKKNEREVGLNYSSNYKQIMFLGLLLAGVTLFKILGLEKSPGFKS
jgi:hypothetical protein